MRASPLGSDAVCLASPIAPARCICCHAASDKISDHHVAGHSRSGQRLAGSTHARTGTQSRFASGRKGDPARRVRQELNHAPSLQGPCPGYLVRRGSPDPQPRRRHHPCKRYRQPEPADCRVDGVPVTGHKGIIGRWSGAGAPDVQKSTSIECRTHGRVCSGAPAR